MPPGEETKALDIFIKEIKTKDLACEEVETANVSHIFINFIKECIKLIEENKEIQQYFLSLIDSHGRQNLVEISEDKFLVCINERIYDPILVKRTLYDSFKFKCNKTPYVLYNLFYKLIKEQRCTSANFGFSFLITQGHYRGCYLDFYHHDYYWPTIIYSKGTFVLAITPQPLHTVISIPDECSSKDKCICETLILPQARHSCIIC